MIKALLISFIFIALPFALLAQEGRQIEGRLLDEAGNPVAFANLAIKGSSEGCTSDETGRFILSTKTRGQATLLISAVGYVSREVPIPAGQQVALGNLSMKEDVLGLDEVVVTGTLKPTSISKSPVKIDIITAEFLQKAITPTNLVEGIAMINGVQEVVACGVCFTNSISVNGLPGAYTAVLMDGTPMYGNLASVYGLNGIPTQIIDRIEVIKGPSSTLYGSEALAGVINIITKKPEGQPLLSADIMGTSHLESFGNVAFAQSGKNYSHYTGLNYAYINDFDDDNGDGFGDNINLDRWSFFSKWSFKRPSGKPFTLMGKYYYEDRRNGVRDFLDERAYQELRGNDSIYGESIYTKRAEVFGSYGFRGSENLRLDYSLSHHDQDSYYGADQYLASQQIAYTNLIWNRVEGSHDLSSGLTLRWQSYDDNTVATERSTAAGLRNAPDRQFIPGIFVQDEWTMSDAVTVLAGARLDHFDQSGLVPAPRLNVKTKLGKWTTLRSNFGTGFRLVNLFTEDHAFITGQREVVIEEELKPERSWNTSLALNHVFGLGESSGMLDVDVYYTRFANKIIPDYDTPGEIRYANTEGHAVSKGLSFNLTHNFSFPLSWNAGINWQQVTETGPNEAGITERKKVEFAPRWSGVFTASYDWQRAGLNWSYTLRLTGPMALPLVYDLDENGQPIGTPRPTESQPFALHTLQVTKTWPDSPWQVYVGIQNLFDYRQESSPLVGFNDPNNFAGFSPFFDTAYAFSPLHGREFYLGIRWNLSPR